MSEKVNCRNNLISAIHAQIDLLNNSKSVDHKTKEALLDQGNYWLNRLENETFTLPQLKSVTNEILTYWRESIGTTTEIFWDELREQNIHFERKDELNFALEKNRFRRVDIGMAARKNWSLIKDFDAIQNRFSSEQIEQIGKIIEEEEKNRLEILRKCLVNQRIPKSQYLKFGECLAYMSSCELWDQYFDKKEIDELYAIWSND